MINGKKIIPKPRFTFLSTGVGEKDGHKEDVSIFIAWAQCVVCVLFILLYSSVASIFSSEAKVCMLFNDHLGWIDIELMFKFSVVIIISRICF